MVTSMSNGSQSSATRAQVLGITACSSALNEPNVPSSPKPWVERKVKWLHPWKLPLTERAVEIDVERPWRAGLQW